ncbi:MAG: hypothetical protein JWM57_3820 [Phycisphaerales bacterium]|nr:hypothetical protein [Phycisphaerales bacterium]
MTMINGIINHLGRGFNLSQDRVTCLCRRAVSESLNVSKQALDEEELTFRGRLLSDA